MSVAPHSLIISQLAIPVALANKSQCSVDPSPTPIVPIFVDLTTEIFKFGNAARRYNAVINPALPPPSTVNVLIIGYRYSDFRICSKIMINLSARKTIETDNKSIKLAKVCRTAMEHPTWKYN